MRHRWNRAESLSHPSQGQPRSADSQLNPRYIKESSQDQQSCPAELQADLRCVSDRSIAVGPVVQWSSVTLLYIVATTDN